MADANQRRLYSRRLWFEPLESRRVLSITVDTLVDENNGVGVGAGTSLREALVAAASGDTIDFSVTGTIVTTGLAINKNVTINGPGAELLTIQAYDSTPGTKTGNGTRAFSISDSNSTNLLNVAISGLTLTGGDVNNGGGAILTTENLVVSDCVITDNASSGSGYLNAGGAILSDPGQSATPNSLTLRNCVVSGNNAANAEGGAIRKRYGTLLIEDCTITGNSAGYGGGLSAADGSVIVQINRSTFSNNRATYVNSYGGGIFSYRGDVTIVASTISGNTAPQGGGIDSSNGYLTLVDTVVSNNTATGNPGFSFVNGGGIWAQNYGLSLTRCTIAGNTAASGFGGGVYSALLTTVDSTFSGNSAARGGGIYVLAGGQTRNSTFSNNTAAAMAGAIQNIGGTLLITSSTITQNNTSSATSPGAVRGTGIQFSSSIIAGNINGDAASGASLGYNLVGTGSTSVFNKTGDQAGVTNPMLGPLADNGGPTKTHAPLAGSPAIDTGNPAFNPADPDGNASTNDAMPFDQRGGPFTRVFGGRIDKGAVESQPVSATVMGDYNQNGVVDAGDYLVWQKARGATGVTPYTGADGTGDGIVNQADLNLWRFHFGSTVPVAGSGVGVEGGRGSVEGGVAAEEVMSEVQADDGRTLKSISIAGAAYGIAGKATTRVRALAEPVAPEVLRDDALVAWVESMGCVREGDAVDFAARESWSDEISGDHPCDALDVAVGELMSAAVL